MGALRTNSRFAAITGSNFCIESFSLLAGSQTRSNFHIESYFLLAGLQQVAKQWNFGIFQIFSMLESVPKNL